jgi:hypothetical protein
MRRPRLPRLAYNTLSFAGTVIALVAGLTMLFFLVFQAMRHEANPYLGIFVYMVLPPFLFVGLLLIPIGMVRRKRILRKTGEEPRGWPFIDLNRRTHRNAFIVFILGTLIYTLLSIVGAYQAYHYTESVTFCGKTCHQVMKPEFTAYQHSPHARVACTACHVGPGANWYAKSKLSGLYQVYAVTANNYPRPIPTPIESLRPAQETCEQCHWPEQFFGAQQRQFNHYMYDEENTHWPINMLIKTGGGDPKTGQTSGIHWHMNISVRVEYIARDEERQDIPWIRITDRLTGRQTVYQDEEEPLTEEEIQAAVPRVMDCMDCHNRPSHKFRSPDYAVDHALLTGQLDSGIPEIKRAAVEAMAADYSTEQEAMHGIANSILGFYLENHPDFYEKNLRRLEQVVLATQNQFSRNIFPRMKVRWENYPDNIGHFINPGCMRCHDGNHKSEDGRIISRDCRSCHAILSQGSGEKHEMAMMEEGLDFVHPVDLGEAWKEFGCYECHTGTQP